MGWFANLKNYLKNDPTAITVETDLKKLVDQELIALLQGQTLDLQSAVNVLIELASRNVKK